MSLANMGWYQRLNVNLPICKAGHLLSLHPHQHLQALVSILIVFSKLEEPYGAKKGNEFTSLPHTEGHFPSLDLSFSSCEVRN